MPPRFAIIYSDVEKKVREMTIEEMRTEIQKLEKKLAEAEQRIPFAANVVTEDYYKELRLKLMGQICAYEYLIQEAA